MDDTAHFVGTLPQAERQRIWVIVVLLFFVAVFWGFFELAGSALNVFTDTHIDKSLGTWKIPASVFQAVNAFFIMLFAPVFTVMWGFLSKRGIEPAAWTRLTSQRLGQGERGIGAGDHGLL